MTRDKTPSISKGNDSLIQGTASGRQCLRQAANTPKGIAAGQTTEATCCLTDLYATLRDLTGQPVEDRGGEDSYSLVPVFNGESTTGRETLVSHSINGSFAIRRGDLKLCLCPGSGGWSAPKGRLEGAPAMQLYDLKSDRGERKNLIDEKPERAEELMQLLAKEVEQGRSTPGNKLTNDREVIFVPEGVNVPAGTP